MFILSRFITTYECGVVMFSVASLCLSVCNALAFESLSLESFYLQVKLQNISIKFVYQCYRVKVKVTGAKSLFVYPVGE